MFRMEPILNYPRSSNCFKVDLRTAVYKCTLTWTDTSEPIDPRWHTFLKNMEAGA
eukprot:SAG31_NODE_32822_length_351_cov_0.817460_1_plen_54_part_01